MERQPTLDRRSVLKTTGGLATMAALGTAGVGTGAAHAHGSYVRVNQVGYLPSAKKVAVVVADKVSGDTFEVVDRGSGQVAASGDLSVPVDDPLAGHTVRHADFSDLEAAGEYEVRVGGTSSFPFEIAEDVYDDLLATTGRLYTLKRSATTINDPVSGINFQAGHTDDARAQVAARNDPEYDQGETVDVAGGWYDAGDYGKYTAPSAIAVGAKLWAYSRNGEAFSTGQYQFPSGVSQSDRGTMPDELVELKWKLEWLAKMQRRDGALWFKVAGKEWPDFVPPAQDTMQRYVFGLSSAATAMACADFAIAARVYRGHDDAFADRMLENAEAAFDWLEANPDMVWRMDPDQDGGSGGYHRGHEFEDPDRLNGTNLEEYDRFWAAAELLKTTGEDRYSQYLESELSHVFSVEPPDFDWYCGLAIGMYSYYTADAGDDARKEEIATAYTSWADDRLAHVEEDGYNNALKKQDYHWASVQKGATFGVMFLLANEMDPNPDYVEAAVEQLHHVLGRSASGYSYVTKTGEHSPKNPHDRLVAGTGTLLPGMVVGGPNDDRIWPEAGLTPSEVPYENAGTAQLYVDDQERFECNEWAINYQAPVFWLLAETVTLDDEVAEPTPTATPTPTDEPTQDGDGPMGRDLDGDGLYEDVNDNGESDFGDVTELFDEMDSPGVADNPAKYDFNGNGELDFGDVVSLFEEM